LLVGPQGRRPVRDDRQRFGRHGQVLMDHDGAVVAIAGAAR
jgi:hypothetical protein